MMAITGRNRYIPDVEWSDKSIVHNLFRRYELLFGRREGIRVEDSVAVSYLHDKRVLTHEIYTIEALCAFVETWVRGKMPKLVFVRVPQLVFANPNYVQTPFAPFVPYINFAIAFDAATAAVGGSFSKTCTGSNLLLIAGVFHNTGDGTYTGNTYNSVALTNLTSQQVGVGTQLVDIWYKVAPATGSNTFAYTGTDATPANYAVSYTGVKQTGFPDAQSSTNAIAASSVTTTLTTVADNCWAVAVVRSTSAGETNNSSAAATGRATGTGSNYWDSNGALTPAGGKTISYSGSVSSWGVTSASFAPVVATANSGFFLAASR